MTVAPAAAPTAPAVPVLSVNETFVSFQGEGPSAGERAVFLRLAGCNLACTWCDTPYSWDWARHDRTVNARPADPADTADDIARLAGPRCRLLVLTGGEPLLQQDAAIRLLERLRALSPDLRCEVETNGTLRPAPALAALVHRFVVSPKLAHAGGPERARHRPHVLAALAAHERTVLKLVVASPADLPEAAAVAETAGFRPDRVWIMPVGTDPDSTLDLARSLARPVLAAGYNLTLRQHLLLWGDTRGT